MFAPEHLARSVALLDLCRNKRLRIATAESCTGGLIAALLTEITGSSDVFERGFVTYSNAAKTGMLGVDVRIIAACGAVSQEVALSMAHGALSHSAADLAAAVTGIAGPSGGTLEKPVGLVHIAVALRGGGAMHRRCTFGDIGRTRVRENSLEAALDMLTAAAGGS